MGKSDRLLSWFHDHLLTRELNSGHRSCTGMYLGSIFIHIPREYIFDEFLVVGADATYPESSLNLKHDNGLGENPPR